MRPPHIIHQAIAMLGDKIVTLRTGQPEDWLLGDDLGLARDALIWAMGGDPDCREILTPFLGQANCEPDNNLPENGAN